MAKSTPQDKYFRYTKLFNRSSSWLLVITVILPILNAVITNSTIDSLLNLINFGVMVVYAGATFFGTFHLLPESENIRRSDYFHNTFGIPTTDDSSEEYFTNDDIERGFYKMAVNMFENCFFSLKVSSEMLLRSMIKMLVFVLILIYFAYNGFQNNLIALSVLQLFLSTIIFGETIKLALYNRNLKRIYNQIESLFSVKDLHKNIEGYSPQIIKLYVSYETNISWGGILLDSDIFNKLNPTLSKKWEQIKKEFTISKV